MTEEQRRPWAQSCQSTGMQHRHSRKEGSLSAPFVMLTDHFSCPSGIFCLSFVRDDMKSPPSTFNLFTEGMHNAIPWPYICDIIFKKCYLLLIVIFTTEIGKLALSSAFLSGQFLYGHRHICTVRGCLRSPSIARAPGKAWTGSLLKLMSPFFLLSQLCFVQPWHNLNLKQLQFTWYYNIQGKNPSDRWFAQFHPLWKHKCYKQQKGRKLLRDAGKYSVSKCNMLYVDKTHWVCEYGVTYYYSGKRS